MPELNWNGSWGFLQVESDGVYNDDYFKKYQGYAETPLGQKLNGCRKTLVSDYVHSDLLVCDVGIGCGQFVESRPNTLGYDVNPAGVVWLRERNLYLNPYHTFTPVLTFWDSLEHIEKPERLLERCTDMVFVSIPIFKDKAHVLSSKHYRPDEHYWYFTEMGFVEFMGELGFEIVWLTNVESKLGREDILTFVFRRKKR